MSAIAVVWCVTMATLPPVDILHGQFWALTISWRDKESGAGELGPGGARWPRFGRLKVGQSRGQWPVDLQLRGGSSDVLSGGRHTT